MQWDIGKFMWTLDRLSFLIEYRLVDVFDVTLGQTKDSLVPVKSHRNSLGVVEISTKKCQII